MRKVSRQQAASSEGAASFYLQTTQFGKSYWLRNILLATTVLLAFSMLTPELNNMPLYGLLALMAFTVNIFSRALLYVVVIPTTMPGAFFWKNKGFVEHARESGLA